MNVMSLEQWRTSGIKAKVQQTSATIRAYGNKKIRMYGKIRVTIKWKGNQVKT